MITDYNVGDRVKITVESWKIIKNGNQSIHVYPCDSFVATAYLLMREGVEGTVTHRFRPGYEMTVEFDSGTALHMKDNWVERVEPPVKFAKDFKAFGFSQPVGIDPDAD